jgi:uncharacterized membrane protein YeaQ/YmgE (transglycosylase-associated protein family)
VHCVFLPIARDALGHFEGSERYRFGCTSANDRGEFAMHVIWFLLCGLIVGALARFLVPGREPGGWIVSLVLGVGGSFLGGLIGRALGLYQPGRTGGGFVLSLIGAIILVAIYHGIMARRATPR